MKGNSSPVADEYNEDTDRANDSEDDQWPDKKLVIDLEPKMSTTDSKTNSPPSKEETKSDTFTAPDNKSGQSDNGNAKPKGKRGAQKRSDTAAKTELAKDSNKSAGKQTKAEKNEKEKPPNKPGRKRKDKQNTNNKSTNGDVKSPTADNDTNDPYKFESLEEGISASVTGKRSNKVKSEPVVMKDAHTECDWRSVGSITEPEHLGPCDPGTQVCLEGIVWQETANGVLVVNVTWKGKTYMGTLLDATKHDWSPPSCESPIGDFDGRTPKGRGKRSRVPLSDTFKDINERKLRKEMRRQSGANTSQPPASPAKSENGKRKGRSSECDLSEPTPKRGRAASRNGPSSPQALIECPEPNCGKKYKQMNGLKYHQKNAHHESQSQVSDSTSDNEKNEPASSSEETKKSKRKNKGDKSKNNQTTSEKKSKSEESDEQKDTVVVASDNCQVTKPTEPVLTRANTTSVITSTSSSQVNNISQSSNVPIATITPQVVKPVCLSNEEKDQNKSTSLPITSTSVNRPLAMTPKLLPKSTGNSMAPISTITAPGAFNPTLKPIQPKPTILGETTPNPGLNDLRDHKKLKRKRSASRDDLTNGNSSPVSDSVKSNSQRSENENRISTSQNNTADSALHLQSPSYSDISDEGELRNAAARREVLPPNRPPVSESAMFNPSPYLVATVSPQKNNPSDKEQLKRPEHSNPSPTPKPVDIKKAELNMEMIKHLSPYPTMWPQMPQELFQQTINAAANNKQRRSVSPRPGLKAPVSQSRDVDSKASSERLQLLRENLDMKANFSGQLTGGNDTPRDYSIPSSNQRPSDDLNKYYSQEREREKQKQDMTRTHSPASRMPLSKPSDSRPDTSKLIPRSSPMPPPGPYVNPYMANSLLPPFSAQAMLQGRAGMNLLPGFPFSLPGMPDIKDPSHRPTTSPLYGNKSDHKIHELEGIHPSKSPRPSSHADRSQSAKSQPVLPGLSQSLFAPYPGFHPSMYQQK